MTERLDVVVVGAGVVGLAVARALALSNREVLVLERHRLIGSETSSRNSGVIHSGIYYPANSLKAKFCVRGRELLYAYCDAQGIAYRRCGKIIVAQEAQVPALRELERKGRVNGVDDLQWLTGIEVRALEPNVRCAAGLMSPSTGVVDAHSYMTALHGDLEAHGGNVVFDSRVVSAAVRGNSILVRVRNGSEDIDLECGLLINSAGLQAADLLRNIDGYPAEKLHRAYYAKGNYFSCTGAKPFRHLMYPMPNEAGLGVHATLDLDGTIRFGPDVEWIDSSDDYQVDAARALPFYEAIREYWPGLVDGALQPAYAGIRPKLVGPGSTAADFIVESSRDHGIAGLISLLGIESPGLTSSLAIAEHVVQLAR
ncbi:MAG TPA: NAD(P)/FAD-dependent oxidoreductase [Steroidobacteraceae bacterium]|nr:NAD(P)/FAD-dependent oxidoreductase [Steroidobacteraceae bacterium]